MKCVIMYSIYVIMGWQAHCERGTVSKRHSRFPASAHNLALSLALRVSLTFNDQRYPHSPPIAKPERQPCSHVGAGNQQIATLESPNRALLLRKLLLLEQRTTLPGDTGLLRLSHGNSRHPQLRANSNDSRLT